MGNTLSDIIIYFSSSFILKYIHNKKLEKYKKTTFNLIQNIGNPSKIIFISKFVYGTRILTIILMRNLKLIPIKKFIFYDFLAITLINGIILTIGWLYGGVITHLFYDNFIINHICSSGFRRFNIVFNKI